MSSERGYGRDLLHDAARDVLRDAKDTTRRVANGLLDGAYDDGFREAANICMSVLAESSADLMKKIKPGEGLSTEEQFLLRRLSELQTEMETRMGRRATTQET